MEPMAVMERMVKTVRPGQKVTPVLRVQLVHGAKRVTRARRAMPANRVLKVILERRAHKAKRVMLVTMGERLSYRKLRCISSGATGVMLLGITSLHYLT